jgi:hypothetical protein
MLVLSARQDDLDWNSLPLWPEGGLAAIDVKIESASRINCVRAEDAFIVCAGHKADLTTLAVHKRIASARARRPNWTPRSSDPGGPDRPFGLYGLPGFRRKPRAPPSREMQKRVSSLWAGRAARTIPRGGSLTTPTKGRR